MAHFFSIMDAVGHPYATPTKQWLGASFAERKEGPMLHDEFWALYWEYKRAMTPRQPAKEAGPAKTVRSRRRGT